MVHPYSHWCCPFLLTRHRPFLQREWVSFCQQKSKHPCFRSLGSRMLSACKTFKILHDAAVPRQILRTATLCKGLPRLIDLLLFFQMYSVTLLSLNKKWHSDSFGGPSPWKDANCHNYRTLFKLKKEKKNVEWSIVCLVGLFFCCCIISSFSKSPTCKPRSGQTAECHSLGMTSKPAISSPYIISTPAEVRSDSSHMSHERNHITTVGFRQPG